MLAKSVYAFTAIVLGTLLTDCQGNITCWKGSSEKGLTKTLCTGRSCYRAKYGLDSDVDYGCWHGQMQFGCNSTSSVIYCVCSHDLCNNRIKQTDTMKTGGIPADLLSAGGIYVVATNTERIQGDILDPKDVPTDELDTGGNIKAGVLGTGSILADVLNTGDTIEDVLKTEGIPADVLNTEGKPVDIRNTGSIQADVLYDGSMTVNVLDPTDEPAYVLNVGGIPADVLNTEGSGGRLNCWIGQEKRLRKRMCNGSCYKTKIGKVVRYGCFPNKRPDGCKQFGRSPRCFCNKDLCNTGEILTAIINTGGTQKDVGLDSGGVQIDLLSTAYEPIYVLNTGSIATPDINTGDISTDDLNTGGLSADDLYTGGVRIDILKTYGIPSDDMNTGYIPIDYLNNGGLSADDLNTGGSEDNLICWSGVKNRLEKKHCYGSCCKTNTEKDILYGCLHIKKPDGCFRYGSKTFCFCNTNLCNTGSIPNNDLNSEGITSDELDRGGIPTDDQNTGATPTYVLNSGHIIWKSELDQPMA